MQKDKVKKASKIQFLQMEGSSGAAAEGQQKTPSKSVEEAAPVAEPSAATEGVPEVVIPDVVYPSDDDFLPSQVL